MIGAFRRLTLVPPAGIRTFSSSGIQAQGDARFVPALALIAALFSAIFSTGRILDAGEGDPGTQAGPTEGKKVDAAPQSRMVLRAVSADSNEALADVQIEFYGLINGGRVTLNLTSDEKGLAEFPWPTGAKIQSLRMTARKPGFVPVHVAWSDGTRIVELPQDFELKFETGRELGGIVQNEEGKPIAGASVQLLLAATVSARQNSVFYAADLTTDEEGQWRWDGAPKGPEPLTVLFRHVDYLEKRDKVQVGLGNKVVLSQGLKVEGQVADRDGKPIVGIAVRLAVDRFGRNEPATTTDADGKFTLTKCLPGRSLVTVQGNGFAPKFQEVSVSAKMDRLSFAMEPGHTLRIRVVDSDGQPIDGAMMAPDSWRGRRSLDLRLTADADGMASWDSAPEDAVLWDFFKQGYMWTRKKSLAPSDEVQVVTLLRPLIITGKVTDAKSGKPIDRIAISLGRFLEDSPDPVWSPDRNEFADGEYVCRFDEPEAGRALKVIADGYQPAISRTFKSDEGNQTFDFQLEPGTGLSGTVLLPDGEPAADAEVGLLTRGRGIMLLRGGRFDVAQNRAEVVRSDASGRFQFSAREDKTFLLLALHDAGYAEVHSADFERSNSIRLSAWGKLEGRVMVENQPDANREVRFHPTRPDSRRTREYLFDYGYAAKADAEGRFQFDRVLPGPGSMTRSIVIEHGSGMSHHFGWNTPVDVRPNDTTTVQIGGTGRPVAGRVRLNQRTEEPIDWATNDVAEIRSLVRDRTTGVSRCRYIGPLLKSGRFRIPDVPPGDYEVTIPVNGARLGDRFVERTVIGRARMEFTVPEVPGGRSNAPLDLGDIEAHLFDTLDPGEIAPDFTAKLLAGGTTRLREHHGKVVLLDFWMSSDPQSIAELPARRKLYERFAENPRFHFLGLSCDRNDAMARKFVEKEAPDWPQAFVGSIQLHIPTLYTVRTLPANFLISPDGKVLKKNLRGAELERAIAEALADEALFAAAGEPSPRFPITAFDAAANESLAPDGIAALVLGDTDASYERSLPHDDHLRAINAKGDVLWEIGGIRTRQSTAAAHVLAADPKRNRIYLVENLGEHLSAFSGAGERVWRADLIRAASAAVDEVTGHIWVSVGSEEPSTVAFDGLGKELSSTPLWGMDMAAAPGASAFWLVGDKIQKFDTSQKTLFSKPMGRVLGVSVAVNPRDGSVWIAERDFSDLQSRKSRLWLLSSEGEVRRELEVEGTQLSALACHPRTGEAYFCGPESGLRRVGAEGPISKVLVESAHNVAISPTNGDIWVGTEAGVLRVDPDGNEISRNSFPRRCRILGILPY